MRACILNCWKGPLIVARDPDDERRKGDQRPTKHKEGVPLTFLPAKGQPFRWLPRHGQPMCVGEWISQKAVKAAAFAPLWTAFWVTVALLFYIFDIGIPFVSGR